METTAPALESAFYRRVLDLSGPEDLDRTLVRGLELLTRLTAADLAYLEAIDGREELRLGCAIDGERDLEALRGRMSREILRVVLGRAETIESPCAIDDERLRELESVRRHQLRGVLCVSLEPIAGAIYLQGPEAFSRQDLEHAELLARHAADQLLRRDRRTDRLALHRATRWFQRRHILAALRRTDWNITEAARELGVAGSYLYKLISSLQLRRAQD